jgi:chloramphenicol O-acetyltransferase
MYLLEFLELLIAIIKCTNNRYTFILSFKDGVIVSNSCHKTIITLSTLNKWFFNVLIFDFSYSL